MGHAAHRSVISHVPKSVKHGVCVQLKSLAPALDGPVAHLLHHFLVQVRKTADVHASMGGAVPMKVAVLHFDDVSIAHGKQDHCICVNGEALAKYLPMS